jgi:hypothetical protein
MKYLFEVQICFELKYFSPTVHEETILKYLKGKQRIMEEMQIS